MVLAFLTYIAWNGHELGLVVNPGAFWLGATPDGRGIDSKAEPPFGLLEVITVQKVERPWILELQLLILHFLWKFSHAQVFQRPLAAEKGPRVLYPMPNANGANRLSLG